MKISSGVYRNRILLSPNSSDVTRPTSDKVRQAIFNIIGNEIVDATFLDLFSGSGAIGIEALSRGAAEVVFNDLKSFKLIETNLKNLNIDNQLVLPFDYKDALRKVKKLEKCFDIIFLDPPYNFKNYNEVVNYIITNNLLSEFGIIIIECNRRYQLEDLDFNVKSYLYNDTSVHFLRRK